MTEDVSETGPDAPSDWLEVVDTETTWRFDRAFLESNWTCIWGRGCHGIETFVADELGRGCCSVGAELDGVDEAMMVSALADTIDADVFQHRAVADELRAEGGYFSDLSRTNTRVVDGACIFLNRPDFEGGAGCALHLVALACDERPIDWKPSVCWQVPVRVDWESAEDGTEVATLRRWRRSDWGPEGETMAWCCTEGLAVGDAYVGQRPVIDSMADELEGIVGERVFVELRRTLRP